MQVMLVFFLAAFEISKADAHKSNYCNRYVLVIFVMCGECKPSPYLESPGPSNVVIPQALLFGPGTV